MNKTQQWQYKIVQITEAMPHAQAYALGEYSEDGWELVGIVADAEPLRGWPTAYFKRPCQKAADALFREHLKGVLISKFPALSGELSQDAQERWYEAYHLIFKDLLAERFPSTNGATTPEATP